MRMLWAIPFHLLIVCCQGTQFCSPNSQVWQPNGFSENRNDIRCNANNCGSGFIADINACCACNTCATWEGSETDLFIEFISQLGKSLVISNQAFNKSRIYRVEYRKFNMAFIPSNVCDWDNGTHLSGSFVSSFHTMREFWGNLVKLDFSYNKIRVIPDINCLVRLDQLILNNNFISHVSNTSFTRLSRLRYLDLHGNGITSIDLNTLSAPQMNLLFADFNTNALQTIDVSNLLVAHPFCSLAFGDNMISGIENEHFKVDFDAHYGPGYVKMTDNLITEFPNFKDLLFLDTWEQVGKFFAFGFDLTNTPLICDCNIQPFLVKADIPISMFMRNTTKDFICKSPSSMKGKSIFKIDQEKLICNMSECPSPHCTCVDKPFDDTMYVTCSGLDKLPKLPTSRHSRFVSLNVSGNNIKEITNVSYLSMLSSLDISNNDLRDISDNVTKTLEENCKFLDISDNPKIRELPKLFQYRDVCSTRMKNLEINSNCKSTWIETWLQQSVCSYDNLFKCNIPDIGVTLAINFHESDLECFLDMFIMFVASVIAIATFVMIITGFSVYTFYYELLIIYYKLTHRKRNDVQPNFKYDVFISFNENEERVTKWVTTSLNRHLMDKGYTPFLALRDLQYGTDRNADVISAIENSRNFLIILSEGYLKAADEGMRSWTENEWKFGWNNFRRDRCKSIILVNYDHMESSAVDHPVIKAYLRVGCTVDFENHDRNIMNGIETKLGKSFRHPGIDINDIEDQTIIPPTHLFVTCSCDDEVSDIELEDKITPPASKRQQPCSHEQPVNCEILQMHPGILKPRHACHKYEHSHVETTSV